MSDFSASCDAAAHGLLPISETTDLSRITYSHEATIAAFKDYFDFLTRMYLGAEHVVQPPEGGWPEITAENLRDLNKTDEVIALLRHLPYVRKPANGTRIHVAGSSAFADWASYALELASTRQPSAKVAKSMLSATEGPIDAIPPHVIGLVESRDYKMFLDTQLGVIYFVGTVFGYPPIVTGHLEHPFKPISDDPYDYAPAEEAEWRGGDGAGDCAWAITEFFEVLKHHFRELNYIPVSRQIVEEKQVLEGDPDRAAAATMVIDIFRQHGWPNLDEFQKDECMDAVEEQIRKHFPDRFFLR